MKYKVLFCVVALVIAYDVAVRESLIGVLTPRPVRRQFDSLVEIASPFLPDMLSDLVLPRVTDVAVAERLRRSRQQSVLNAGLGEDLDASFLKKQRTVRRGRVTADDAEGAAASSSKATTIAVGETVQLHLKLTLLEPPYTQYFYSRSSKDITKGAFSFTVGKSEVFPALDEAVQQMVIGERALFSASHDKCYGPRGFQPWGIPPFAPLQLDVEVLPRAG